MGLSAGTGSPIVFRCSACRAGRFRGGMEATLTGRERPYKPPRGCALGSRSTRISREYQCAHCGHIGWSNHADLEKDRFKSTGA